MKKLTQLFAATTLTIAVAGATIGSAVAQVAAYRQGGADKIEGYALPRTVVSVTVVTEREVILRGPYAKFASQYLGIVGAAMSDKENYKIVDASLGYFEEPDPAMTYHLNVPVAEQVKGFRWLTSSASAASLLADADFAGAQLGGNNPFTDMGKEPLYGVTTERSGLSSEDSFGVLPVNRTSPIEKSVEQMASDAASAIFTLRKRRFDLVTGETGEGVFGAGLPAALKEIDRLESEYLSLFIGKRYTQRIVRTVNVLPQRDKKAVVACRFSTSKGIVPESDLSGQPLMLEFAPESEGVAQQNVELSRKGAVSVRYRVPAVQIVRLVDGTDELARERVPVFQFGAVAQALVVF